MTNLLTEFDGDMTTRFQVNPYSAIISGTEFRTQGVIVETAGYDGVVGMGTVRFGKVQFNGNRLPFAFLDGLKVRKEFRGNGLGFQIASWRIQQARNEFGEDCVIGTGMLHDNHASHAVASKWCREFAESAFDVRLVPMLTHKPRSLAGITIREIEPRELPIQPFRMDFIKEAMISVVKDPRGTAYFRLRGLQIPVAGKTGTAESGSGLPHAWFAGYTMASENTGLSDIAIAVILENQGEGSDYAAPVFRQHRRNLLLWRAANDLLV